MLSYQHIYHAGNAADIHKHLWLVVILEYLLRKPKPFCWIDTHGGRGLYNLHAPEAQKLGEYKTGYLALKEAFAHQKEIPPALANYLNMVASVNEAPDHLHYPGSSLIAAQMLRSSDFLYSFDMHPQEIMHLQAALKPFDHARARKEDGYQALKSLIPPKQKRGGVLIDPSYEVKSEYAQVSTTLQQSLRKWRDGVFMIWYPLLPAGHHKILVEEAGKLGAEILIDEWIFKDPAENMRGLYGSGMIIANPPYTTPETMAELKSLILPILSASL